MRIRVHINIDVINVVLSCLPQTRIIRSMSGLGLILKFEKSY